MQPNQVLLADLPLSDVKTAIALLPETWISDLDYDFVDGHAEEVDAFFRRIIPQLPPGQAFEMAAQCQQHYVLGLAHLDARSVAAELLIDSTRRLLDHIAEILIDTDPLADGPDAGISDATQQRLLVAAQTLRELNLSIEPPEV